MTSLEAAAAIAGCQLVPNVQRNNTNATGSSTRAIKRGNGFCTDAVGDDVVCTVMLFLNLGCGVLVSLKSDVILKTAPNELCRRRETLKCRRNKKRRGFENAAFLQFRKLLETTFNFNLKALHTGVVSGFF